MPNKLSVRSASEDARRIARKNIARKWTVDSRIKRILPDSFDEVDHTEAADRIGQETIESLAGRMEDKENGLSPAPCGTCGSENCPGAIFQCLRDTEFAFLADDFAEDPESNNDVSEPQDPIETGLVQKEQRKVIKIGEVYVQRLASDKASMPAISRRASRAPAKIPPRVNSLTGSLGGTSSSARGLRHRLAVLGRAHPRF